MQSYSTKSNLNCRLWYPFLYDCVSLQSVLRLYCYGFQIANILLVIIRLTKVQVQCFSLQV